MKTKLGFDATITFRDPDLYGKLMNARFFSNEALGDMINGIRVIQSDLVQEAGVIKQVLLSNTGKPRGITRMYRGMVPSKTIYRLSDGVYLCHPMMYNAIVKGIEEGKVT